MFIKKAISIIQGRNGLYEKILNHPFPENIDEDRKSYFKIEVRNKPDNELNRIFRGADQFECLDIYVHGSWADNTRTPFSDLDDLIIIDRNKLINKTDEIRKMIRWLAKVELRFYRLDILQHHGHWIIFKDELAEVDESYIPINVLREAVLIKGNSVVEYKINTAKTKIGLKRNIKITAGNIAYLINDYYSGKISVYDMKALIGSFLLMPAYIFQYKGKIISKRDAIEKKKEILSLTSCKLLDKCSEMRLKWGKGMSGYRNSFLKIMAHILPHPYLFKHLNRRFSTKFPVSAFPVLTKNEVEQFLKEVEEVCQ